jgi:hypothetical protein
MNRSAILAWAVTVALAVVALVAVIVRPIHWERTALLAGAVAIVAAVLAVSYTRRPARP